MSSIINTTIGNNDNCMQYHCFTFLNSEFLIDEISAIALPMTPQFGHSVNNTNFSTLYLLNFESKYFENTISLINVGVPNGTVIFEPCILFDSALILAQDMIFDASKISPTNLYDVSDINVKNILKCTDPTICYIQCTSVSFVCGGSHLISNSSNTTLIECDTKFSCLGATLDISLTSQVSIICNDPSSCQQSIISVANVNIFSLECIATDSCKEAHVNVTNTNQVEVHCYGVRSCDSIRIFSDANDIKLNFHSYNVDVQINVPSEFILENLFCNPSNAYLSLDAVDFISLSDSADTLFGGGMPCQHVEYSFTDLSRVKCEIRYNYHDVGILNYLKDYMSCFERIYIDNFTDYGCYGTANPTTDPTTYPTVYPTKTPTRQPTEHKAYDSYFDIIYLLGNLNENNFLQILDDAVAVFENIVIMIETAYIESTPFLQFSDFWVIVDEINDIKINKLDKDKDKYSFDLSEELRLDSKILCNEVVCEHILSTYDITEFELDAQSKIREYFNSTNATFRVDTSFDIAINVLYPATPNPLFEPIILFMIGLMFVMTMLSLFALLHNKQKLCSLPGFNVVDDAFWLCFIILGLQIIDFFSDINLFIEMMTKNKENNFWIMICAYLSLTFILIPYIVNLMTAAKIKKFVSNNVTATTYFTNYSNVFVILVCLCGGCYTALQFVSSAVFGLNMFNSGLTSYEMRRLSKLKVIGTVFLENIPQLLVQFIYSLQLESVSINTYLAFTASVVSVISAVLYYFIEKSTDDTFKVVEYDICTENDHNKHISVDERELIIGNKGKTDALSKEIAAVFSTPYKNIEISKQSTITNYGVVCHFVHYINNHDMISMKQLLIKKNINTYILSPQYVIFELYSMFEKEINEAFQLHFKINNSFKIKISQYSSKENQTTGKSTNKKSRNSLLEKMETKINVNEYEAEIELNEIISDPKNDLHDTNGNTNNAAKVTPKPNTNGSKAAEERSEGDNDITSNLNTAKTSSAVSKKKVKKVRKNKKNVDKEQSKDNKGSKDIKNAKNTKKKKRKKVKNSKRKPSDIE